MAHGAASVRSAMVPALVLSFLPSAIPLGTPQAPMAPIGKPHWGCGSVTDLGTTWNPNGSLECGGNSAILAHGGAGKCWLRKKVDLPKCEINADYDYYLYDRNSNQYRKIDHHNCFAWHGADPNYGHDTLFLNLAACKNKCKNEDECEGFVMESQDHNKTAAMEMTVESCWLLKGVIANNCLEGAIGYTVMMHDPTNPGEFGLQFSDMRCFAFKGADSTYGQSPLKFADGELVTHLGDCKAACHTDDSCEAVQIQGAANGTAIPANGTAPANAAPGGAAPPTAGAAPPAGDAAPPAAPLDAGTSGTSTSAATSGDGGSASTTTDDGSVVSSSADSGSPASTTADSGSTVSGSTDGGSLAPTTTSSMASDSTDGGGSSASNATGNGSMVPNDTASDVPVLPSSSTPAVATTPVTDEAPPSTTTLTATVADSEPAASNGNATNSTNDSGAMEPAMAALVVPGVTTPVAPAVTTPGAADLDAAPISYNPTIITDSAMASNATNGTNSSGTGDAGAEFATTTSAEGLAGSSTADDSMGLAGNSTVNDSDVAGPGLNVTGLFEEQLVRHQLRSELRQMWPSHVLLAGFTCFGLAAAVALAACVQLRSGRMHYRSVAQQSGLSPSGMAYDEMVEA